MVCVAGYVSSLQSATMHTSRPVEVVSDSGAPRTLGDALRDLMPALFADAATPAGREAGGGGNGGSGGGSAHTRPAQQVGPPR
jgi:hypothetical protein